MILAPILTAAEILINPLLQMDETTLQRLTSIEGKLIQVEVIDWQIIYGIVPHQSGVQLLSKIEGRQADCRIRGKLMDLCQVFCNRGSTPALFKQSIDIEGDPELAEKIHEIMQKLDIDWEGLSTHVFGDLLGMQVAKQISDFTAVAKQTCQTLKENTIDYLQAETNQLPTQYQVEEFNQNVNTLRDDVERAAIRVERLVPSMTTE